MRLFVFKPDGWSASDRRPALLHFFGGGFVRGTPLQSAGRARAAAKLGLIGVVADYRTRERFGTDVSACVADARAALRFLQTHAAEFGLDPDRVVVSGSSAGGYLALWTAITKAPPGSDPAEAPLAKPIALILASAAADTSGVTGQRTERFGPHAAELSPLQHLDPQMPPVLMFHGDADQVVPYDQAVALHRQLAGTGNACDLVTIPGGGHGITSPEWKDKAAALEKAFLEKLNLIPPSAPAR